MRHLDLVGLQSHGGTNNMITPQFIGLWLTMSAVVFFVIGIFVSGHCDKYRSANTLLAFVAQAVGAAIAYAIYS